MVTISEGRVRPRLWVGAIALLLLPLVAMQFTDQVAWGPSDFLVFGAMLLGAVGSYELLTKRGAPPAGHVAAGIAIAAAFLLAWVNLAVGFIGDEGNPANLLFAGVLAVAAGGAVIARFRPGGMARAMLATAVAQALVAAIALTGAVGPVAVRDLLLGTAFFTVLWLASAWLFHRATRQ